MSCNEHYGHGMANSHDQHPQPNTLQEACGGTPFGVDAYTGRATECRIEDMRKWCRDNYGPEAWPVLGKPCEWYSGSATINGWTRFEFATETMMTNFLEAWPTPDDAKRLPKFANRMGDQ